MCGAPIAGCPNATSDLSHYELSYTFAGDVQNVQKGLVPRVAPLAEVPEREVFLYAHLHDLPFDHGECPHAARAARNVFRDVLWRLEEAIPGTRQSLLRTRERLLEHLEGEEEGAPQSCSRCGEPSSGPVCRSCEFRDATRLPVLARGVP